MHRQFRALIRALLWCVTQYRPDVAFNVSVLSTRCQAPTVADVLEGNKVLAKIKRKVVKLRYTVLNEPMELVSYCDASWENARNSGATIGWFLWLIVNPMNNRFHMIG